MNQAAIPSLAEDLKKLNEQQTAIIRKFSRPSLIVAGPGTGKTRTISVLIGDLLQKGTRLREILALTFSDKAALELRERVLQYYPHSFDQCWISTFHSFCARILREQYWLVGIKPDFKLLTGFKEALMMSTVCGRQQPEAFAEFGKVLCRRGFQQEVLTFISLLKSNLVDVDDFAAAIKACQNLSDRTRARLGELLNLFRLYERERALTGYLDFRDLISLSIRVLQNPAIAGTYRDRFRVILVDEFQDTDPAQFLLLCLLKGEDDTVKTAVIGDPRQSIYRFRGADPSMMTANGPFKKRFNARVFPLEINYRSARGIVEAAGRLAWKNGSQADGALQAFSERQGSVRLFRARDELEEARMLARKLAALMVYGDERVYKPSEIAILVRNNYQIDLIAECLQALHVPFEIAGDMKFFRSEEVIALVALLKIAASDNSPERNNALQRAFASPVFRLSPLWIQAVLAELSPSLTMQNVLEKISTGDFSTLPETDPETILRAASFAEMVNILGGCAVEPLPAVLARLLLTVSHLLKDPSSAPARNILHFRSMLADYCEMFQAQHSRPPTVSDLMPGFDEWLTYYASTLEQVNDAPVDGVRIMTVHQSKGLEFPVVAVCGLCEGQFPVNLRENLLVPTPSIEELRRRFDQMPRPVSFFNPYPVSIEDHLEEERRLFYVAMTRAKESLILTFPQRLGSDPASPAPFLHEIGLQPEMAETEDRPLTLGEVRTRLTRLSPEMLAAIEPVLQEVEQCLPAGASVHGVRPRSFTTHATDMIQLPEDYCFTASSLANYVDCPRRFFFLNILRIQDPLLAKLPHFITGNAFHACLEHLHRPGSIWELGKKPDEKDIYEIFTAAAAPMLGNIEFFQRHLESDTILKALPLYCSAIYDCGQLPARATIGVEHPFNFKLHGCRFRGRFDRLVRLNDDSVLVVDYKTSSDTLSSEKVFEQAFPAEGRPRELQMPLYLLACRMLGHKNAAAALLYIKKEPYKKAYKEMQAGFLRSASLNAGCGPDYGLPVSETVLNGFEQQIIEILDEIMGDRTFDCRPSSHPDARSCLNYDSNRQPACEFLPFCQERLAALKIGGDGHV